MDLIDKIWNGEIKPADARDKKQINTIEDQGEKQILAVQGQGQVKAIKKDASDDEDIP